MSPFALRAVSNAQPARPMPWDVRIQSQGKTCAPACLASLAPQDYSSLQTFNSSTGDRIPRGFYTQAYSSYFTQVR